MSVRVLPLQALSLLLLPLPWTLPRLFALLVANPVAVVEGMPPFPSPVSTCMRHAGERLMMEGLSLLEWAHRSTGGEVDEVLERSRKLAEPLHRPLVVPYVGLTVVARALSAAKGALLAAIPTRWVREIPEIPIAAYIVLLFVSVLLTR